jgi:hypothetical protein
MDNDAPPPDKAKPDCLKCVYHYITHDANFPYGCRAHGFKSRRKPQLDVLEASHSDCLAYEEKREQKR